MMRDSVRNVTAKGGDERKTRSGKRRTNINANAMSTKVKKLCSATKMVHFAAALRMTMPQMAGEAKHVRPHTTIGIGKFQRTVPLPPRELACAPRSVRPYVALDVVIDCNREKVNTAKIKRHRTDREAGREVLLGLVMSSLSAFASLVTQETAPLVRLRHRRRAGDV